VLHWRVRSLGFVANAIAEVRGLIHVQPQAVERNICIEIIQVLLPPHIRRVLEEVWIHSVDGPHFASEVVRTALNGFHKYVLLNTGVVNFIVTSFSLSDAGIKDRNVLKVVFMQIVNDFWKNCEVNWIISEVLVAIHVVDITPDCIKR